MKGLTAVLSVFIAATLASGLASSLPAQKNNAANVLQPDKGKFNILLDGKSIGKEEFEISANGAGWLAKGTTQINTGDGPETQVTGNLTLQSNGVPMAYDWVSKSDKTNSAHVIFANGIAKISL